VRYNFTLVAPDGSEGGVHWMQRCAVFDPGAEVPFPPPVMRIGVVVEALASKPNAGPPPGTTVRYNFTDVRPAGSEGGVHWMTL
jgi:hypothetical protein